MMDLDELAQDARTAGAIYKDTAMSAPDWSKNSLAVIASSGGAGWVMFYVGAYLDHEIEAVGRGAEDLGICPDDDGIWIWEGKYVGGGKPTMQGDYTEWEPDGVHRAPTEAEWTAIRAGDSPWDPEDWLLPEHLELENEEFNTLTEHIVNPPAPSVELIALFKEDD